MRQTAYVYRRRRLPRRGTAAGRLLALVLSLAALLVLVVLIRFGALYLLHPPGTVQEVALSRMAGAPSTVSLVRYVEPYSSNSGYAHVAEGAETDPVLAQIGNLSVHPLLRQRHPDAAFAGRLELTVTYGEDTLSLVLYPEEEYLEMTFWLDEHDADTAYYRITGGYLSYNEIIALFPPGVNKVMTELLAAG